MAESFDDELLQDAADDARCVEYIRAYLPQELKEKFDDDLLYYFLDVIYDYYYSSGILEAEGDEGYIEVDMEAVARYMAETASKDGMGSFDPEDLIWIANGEAEYTDQAEEQAT